MSGLEYINEDLAEHPQCVHGPTFLFSQNTKNGKKRFFTCSACRDRKDCPFYLLEGDKYNKELLKEKQLNFVEHINHVELSNTLDEVYKMPENKRKYCQECNLFIVKESKMHKDHDVSKELTNRHLNYPSTWLKPKVIDKKEAQYLFSQSVVTTIVNILKDQSITNVLCIGTPRIHEYIRAECKEMKSLLLDIEERYHTFYKPQEFCWYNLFNHYFFKEDSKKYYIDFLKQTKNKKMVVLLDPPFGGRTESISQTLDKINEDHKLISSNPTNLPVILFMPYFMEQHIMNHISYLKMADYKVDYDNHTCFTSNPKGRKNGSPVRIFTNIPLSKMVFYSDDYRYCDVCEKYVYKENKHCYLCNHCPSKDGSSYVHCNKCNRCVKPSWIHCQDCRKCAQKDHKCGEVNFGQSCFHCHEEGHKRSDCPNISASVKRKGNQMLQHKMLKKRK